MSIRGFNMTSIWTRVRALVSCLRARGIRAASRCRSAAKIYSLNVSPLGTSPIQLTMKNETPNGNSTINRSFLAPGRRDDHRHTDGERPGHRRAQA